MTFRIEKKIGKRRTIIRLIGRIRAEDLTEVQTQIKGCGSRITLELDEVTLVDVHVVRFLSACESEGVRLLNCSPYIREWMNREKKNPDE